uniref:Uncharacterized protein n=1 Tax=Anguilla anguilla TaxID=7936 RepID=A0A0E9QBT4_ANGAN
MSTRICINFPPKLQVFDQKKKCLYQLPQLPLTVCT